MAKILEKPEKIRLGRYPYTFVRTVVMRSMLFKKQDYDKMLKMSFSEIAKFLQDSSYRKEIDELATQFSGADLIELSLNRNLSRSFKKLKRISPNELGLLISEYSVRKDIEDIKTILRGKFTASDEKSILNSLTNSGTLNQEFLASLLKKGSIEEILKSLKMFGFSIFREGLEELKATNSLAGIENALDQYYYRHMIDFSPKLPKQGALFRNFLMKEIEITNLLTIFRLKRNNAARETIRRFIIMTGSKAKDNRIILLANTENFEDLAKALEKSEYKSIIAGGIEELKKSGSIIRLENDLYKHLLKESILFTHQHPLSIDVILGYMFAKDLEIRNLRILVKGKQLGLKEEFIESQLVY